MPKHTRAWFHNSEMEHLKIPLKKFLPGIAWFFIVVVLTLMPGKDVPEVDWLDNITDFDKIVHMGLFGGLVILFSLPFLRSSFSYQQKMNIFIRICLAVIVWGITIEFIQKYFVVGRDFDLFDWLADSVGAVSALFLIIYLVNRLEKKRH
ncbi:MAG: VanZ family protein [Ginsengibacter sp.]